MSGKKGGFFASKGYKNLMKYVYGYGAAIVIVGALFKIQHWPGADIMLIAGLSTEAVIFGLSAMEPLHAEPNWAVYYPYLLPENERPQGQDLSLFPKPHEIGGGSGSGVNSSSDGRNTTSGNHTNNSRLSANTRIINKVSAVQQKMNLKNAEEAGKVT